MPTMAEKVLLIDDDERVLHAYHRVLRRQFPLEVAMGGEQALQALEQHGPFAVIVADMRMPGMSGLDVLEEAVKLAPDAVRIMLTGNQDQKTAMDAVNRGHVFRFLSKPCETAQLAEAIQAGLRQHQLITAEREVLEQTLMGSLQVLTDLLSNLDPDSFGRGRLLRERAQAIGRDLQFDAEWDLQTAALLLPIGRIALPPELLARLRAGIALSPQERSLLDRVPETGAQLLERIPRLRQVALFVRYHAKSFDGSGYPADGLAGEDLPLGARILRVLDDFTHLELRRRNRQVALEELALHPEAYDPRVLAALYARYGTPAAAVAVQERACAVEDLEEDMVLARNVATRGGRTVLVAGLQLGAAHLVLLRDLVDLLDLQEPLYVRQS
jgi:response regulator RpfG family c-di-GMP phosphodiesterase